MKLNHLDLSVTDVIATRNFFVSNFDFKLQESPNPDLFAILKDKDNFTLVISPIKKSENVKYPSQFHIGFLVDSREEVLKIHARLISANVKVPEPVESRRGFMFYFNEPSGTLIEVSSR